MRREGERREKVNGEKKVGGEEGGEIGGVAQEEEKVRKVKRRENKNGKK